MAIDETPKPTMRGWAALPPAVHRALCRKGGIAAHAKGTAHEFTTEEAREAGRKGGIETRRRRRERGAVPDLEAVGEGKGQAES